MKVCKTCGKEKADKMFRKHRLSCKECLYKKTNLWRKFLPPWHKKYNSIQSRIRTKTNYYKHNNIKCKITIVELEYLWRRDGADSMKVPSIDRINSAGDYKLSNCRFIELLDNLRRPKLERTKRRISEARLKKMREMGYLNSPEARLKMSESHKKKAEKDDNLCDVTTS